ncbi:hypothetical protein KDH83_18400 [Achromobacter sp. Marseille-Q0513]|uniref:helix-turn-helix transcriptional regulator n=1 Tax=Achromobacter sp. Marseille-Q0513 TaxID=2829161 RepID=UPI001BA1C211|nr:hypothetical protein [Achromobacter sp. Marseille-Q0513]MBR8655278.1 hypothetical protein [Achromobacter sp. Marseille-Q0513]
MRRSTQEEESIIDAAYDAILDDTRLAPAMLRVAGLMGCGHGTLMQWNTDLIGPPASLLCFSREPERFQAFFGEYLEHYSQFDPTRDIAGRFAGGWFIDERDLSPRARSRNPMAGGLLPAHGYGGWAAMELKHGRDMWAISFERDADVPGFTPEGVARVDRIAGHLKRVLLLRYRTAELRQVAAIGLGALHSLSVPMWIVEADGRVLFGNDAGGPLLAPPRALFETRGQRLKPASQAQQAAFAWLLAAAAAPLRARGGALGLQASDGERIAVQVLPLPPHLAMTQPWQRPLAVVLAHPRGGRAPDAVLQALYGFTPAECRVAAGLLDDCTVEELAGRFLVKPATVRAQIKSMLAKSQCRRQAEMIRLFASLAVAGDRG